MSSVDIEATAPLSLHNDEILNDEQIEQLLQEAETRLRQKAGLAVKPTETEDTISFDDTESKPVSQIHKLKLQHDLNQSSYITNKDGIAKADPSLLITAEQKKMANELRPVETGQKSKKVNDQTTSGPQWFDLPKTELTPQMKRDLQIIEMRNVLDPHRHYKKNTRKGKVPTFSQVGTVVEGPTEWFSGRINKKDRGKNLVEEAMMNEQETGRFKRKFQEITDRKRSGKKTHYKKRMDMRKKKR